jgi:ABC-type multidrug transport system fused ATPase/permease subunit
MKFLAALSVEQSLVLNLSPFLLGVVCILGPVILALAGLLVTRKLIPAQFLSQHHDVTGAIFGTLGTVYGIFLAFIVATTWQFYSTTGSNLVQEARCLGDLYSNAQAFPPGFRDDVRKLMRDYREALVDREWKSLERGKADPRTEQLLDQLTDAYANHKVDNLAEGAFFQESVGNLNHLKELRSSRLDDASSGLIPFLWCVLLAGAAATVGFSFLFAPRNFFAQAIMTILLTGVISLTLYTIVNLDFPFSGLVAIPPEPIEKLEMK